MKQKVMAYPLSQHNLVVIQNKELLKDFDIVRAVSTEISINDDIAFIPKEGFLFNSFEAALQDVDAVLILPLSDYANIDMVIDKIKYALINKIRVLSMQKFDFDTLSSFSSFGNDLFINLLDVKPLNLELSYELMIHRIETPLVVVGGISDECELPHLQLQLRSRLLKHGYKVSQIGSMNYSEVFGFHSIPQFMTDNSISASDKIYRFNRFIKEIEVSEQSDIIILGLPNALCPYNNKFTLGFGVIPFYISQAIVSDYSIIVLNYGEYSSEFIKNLKSVLHYRFNFEPDCLLMSDTYVDYTDIDHSGSIRYFNCGAEQVDKEIQNCADQILNIGKESNLDLLVEQLIENLSSNYL